MIGATWVGRAAVVGAGGLVATLLYAVFPLLAHVIGMAGHEAGHALSGWLLGMPSVPVPYLTLHFDYSWVAHVVVLVAVSAASLAAGRTRPWVAAAGLCLVVVCATLGALGLSAPVSTYLGNGGAVLLGGGLIVAAWTGAGADRALVAFFGFSMVFDALGLNVRLATDEAFRAAYSRPGGSGFGFDNDYVVIATQLPDLSVDRLAWVTVALAVVTLLVANLIGLGAALSADRGAAL